MLKNTFGAVIMFGLAVMFAWLDLMSYSGLALVASAVLAMNGAARLDYLAMKIRNNRYIVWLLHHISNESEIAAISLAIFAWLLMPTESGEHFHWPLAPMFTLLGLMSYPRLISDSFVAVLSCIENKYGRRSMLVVGSLMAFLIGEPAASVVMTTYLKARFRFVCTATVGVILAMMIGFGGGLMFHAAPPILIVWHKLQADFGWNLLHLIGYLSPPVLVAVITGAYLLDKQLETKKEDELDVDIRMTIEKSDLWKIGGLIGLVLLHIFAGNYRLVWLLDIAIALVTAAVMHLDYQDLIEARKKELHVSDCADLEGDQVLTNLREEKFTATAGAGLLAVLLAALDYMAVLMFPLMMVIAGAIQAGYPVWLLSLFAFAISAAISAVSDNAMATASFIPVAILLIPGIGMGAATIIAIAILLGSLTGGFYSVPGNLPNFNISREFKIHPQDWIPIATKKFWWVPAIPVIYLVLLNVAFEYFGLF